MLQRVALPEGASGESGAISAPGAVDHGDRDTIDIPVLISRQFGDEYDPVGQGSRFDRLVHESEVWLEVETGRPLEAGETLADFSRWDEAVPCEEGAFGGVRIVEMVVVGRFEPI